VKKAIWLIVIVFSLLLSFFLLPKIIDKPPKQINNHTVVATIYPLYFLTKEIVGGQIEVQRLIKPGNEIHAFSPTPVDMVTLDRSDLLITLGRDLEPWTQKLEKATGVKVLSLEGELSLVHGRAGHDHAKEHRDRDRHSGINPHVWLDFDNDIKMVEMIRDTLAVQYPESSLHFQKNASRLIKKLESIKKAYTEGLAHCSREMILVGHDAFGYMERRYGFETQSIMGIFAHSRPNAAKIAALSDEIQKKNLHYLFIDPMESSKSAIQLAEDMSLKLERLYALGNITLRDEQKGEDMITLLYFNLTQLQKGLECH